MNYRSLPPQGMPWAKLYTMSGIPCNECGAASLWGSADVYLCNPCWFDWRRGELPSIEVEMWCAGASVFERISLGPTLAHELLKLNTHNRPLSPSVVAKYAATMRLGLWRPHPRSPIAISTAGRFLNGQHRLHAIADSGIVVVAWLFTCDWPSWRAPVSC